MHYYKFNIGDYASHTRHLSPIEDIAYRRMLDLAYTTESPLPKDIHQLSRLVNLREYEQAIADVLVEFFDEVDDGWIHGRVLQEIEASGERSEKASKSALARWKKAKVMLDECERNANASISDAPSINNDATHYPLPITHNTLPITQYPEPKTQKVKTIAPLALLATLGILEPLASDFAKLRSTKKAPITKTAMDGIDREAKKANISFEDAIRICCERGWAGFKAEWYENAAPKQNRVQEARLDVAHQIMGGKNGTNRQTFDIDAIRTIESDGEGIPKAIARLRESDAS